MTINKERLLMLIEALESGKYQQTTGALRKAGNYCCLGVACDLMDPGKWQNDGDWVYCGNHASLPVKVMLYYGFNFNNPYLHTLLPSKTPGSNMLLASLAAANDGGYTFKEIAQVLRDQFLQEAEA
jgi:hypothetical protein